MTHGFSSTDKSKKPINCYYDFDSGKLYAYDSNEELQEITIGGGGGMPILDYANPLHTFSANNLSYTANKDCYVSGALAAGSTNCTLSINGTNIAWNGFINFVQDNRVNFYISPIKIKSGDIVAVNSAADFLHVFDVIS